MLSAGGPKNIVQIKPYRVRCVQHVHRLNMLQGQILPQRIGNVFTPFILREDSCILVLGFLSNKVWFTCLDYSARNVACCPCKIRPTLRAGAKRLRAECV